MEITMRIDRWISGTAVRKRSGLALMVVAVLFVTGAWAAAPADKTYASPEDAVNALVAALKAHDRAATLAVLGNVGEWISSGDKVADRAVGDRFVAAYDAKHAITRDGDTAKLVIGNDDFPFAFPIVKTGERWRFDTEAGKDELLARRIGENELDPGEVREGSGERG